LKFGGVDIDQSTLTKANTSDCGYRQDGIGIRIHIHITTAILLWRMIAQHLSCSRRSWSWSLLNSHKMWPRKPEGGIWTKQKNPKNRFRALSATTKQWPVYREHHRNLQQSKHSRPDRLFNFMPPPRSTSLRKKNMKRSIVSRLTRFSTRRYARSTSLSDESHGISLQFLMQSTPKLSLAAIEGLPQTAFRLRAESKSVDNSQSAAAADENDRPPRTATGLSAEMDEGLEQAPAAAARNNGVYSPSPAANLFYFVSSQATAQLTAHAPTAEDRSTRTTSPADDDDSDIFTDSAPTVMPAAVEPVASSQPPVPPTALPNSLSLPIMRKASNLPLPAYPTPLAPWQGANGASPPSNNASTSGKTSQVIEKLTGDADRLRRELRAERAAKDEAIQEAQAMKARIRYLEEQNGTLSLQNSANDGALARKERRLDDLRSRVEQEERRRQTAEQQASIMASQLEETVSKAQKEVSEARTKEKYAEAAYTTIRQEYEALESRIKTLRQDLGIFQKAINEQRAQHLEQTTRLEVLLDQQRQRQETSDKTVDEMASLVRSYQRTEESVKQLETEMADTVQEMRWVMRLHQARGE
jgi:hypothetical protein